MDTNISNNEICDFIFNKYNKNNDKILDFDNIKKIIISSYEDIGIIKEINNNEILNFLKSNNFISNNCITFDDLKKNLETNLKNKSNKEINDIHNNNYDLKEENNSIYNYEKDIESINKFNQLKEISINKLGIHIVESLLKKASGTFNHFSKQIKGYWNYNEMNNFLESSNKLNNKIITEKEKEEFFNNLDIDKNNSITCIEFFIYILNLNLLEEEY